MGPSARQQWFSTSCTNVCKTKRLCKLWLSVVVFIISFLSFQSAPQGVKKCTQTYGTSLIASTVLVLLMGSGKAHLMDVLQMLMKARWVLLYDGRCDTAVTDKGVCVLQTVSLAGRRLWLPSMSPLFLQQIATILRPSNDLGTDQSS